MIRAAAAATFALFLAAGAALAEEAKAPPPPEEEAPANEGAIEFSRSLIPEDDKGLRAALDEGPSMVRGRPIYAPPSVAGLFMDHPRLTYRMLTEFYSASFTLNRTEKEKEYEIGFFGRTYYLTPLISENGVRVLKFSFFYNFPLGIGLKSSGKGILVTRVREGEEPGETAIDYDLYLVTGDLPLDKVTRDFPLVQKGLAQSDIETALDSFSKLCLDAAEEPEILLDDMEFTEGLFTEEEIATIREKLVKQEE